MQVTKKKLNEYRTDAMKATDVGAFLVREAGKYEKSHKFHKLATTLQAAGTAMEEFLDSSAITILPKQPK